MKKIEILIMGLLSQLDQVHGYQLVKIAEERHLLGWAKMKQSSIYKHLCDLEKKELVISEKKIVGKNPPRKVFSLTKAGKIKFNAELKKYINAALEKPNRDFMVSISFMKGSLEKQFVLECLEKRIDFFKKMFEHVGHKKKKLIEDDKIHFPNVIYMKFGIKHMELNLQLLEELKNEIETNKYDEIFINQEEK